MAYSRTYTRINWQDDPSEATALESLNLNKMDSAIYELDGRTVDMSGRLDTDETALGNKVDKQSGKGLSEIKSITISPSVNTGTKIAEISYKNQDNLTIGYEIKNGVVVDSALSSSSENPVQNKVVKSAIDAKSTVSVTPVVTEGTVLANITIDGTTTAIKGSDIEVDDTPSATSENPLQNKAIYEMMNNLLPEETAEGNPIAISDASGLNAKACSVDLLPIQDLHGYDNPWVGGSGKNKAKGFIVQTGQTGTVTKSNETYTMSATGFFIDFKLSANTDYNLSFKFVSGRISNIRTYTDMSATTQLNEYGTYITADYSRNIRETSDCYVRIWCSQETKISDVQLELGTTATAFQPWENICPISGRTQVSVTRTGKNLVKTVDWGGNQYKCQGYGVNGGSPKLSFNGKLKSGTYTLSLLFKNLGNAAEGTKQGLFRLWLVKNNTVYTFNSSTGELLSTSAGGTFVFDYNANLPSNNTRISSNPFKIAEDIDEIRMGFYQSGKYVEIDEIQIELGSLGSEYEPYQGETVTVQLGQTVYGGTLDVTNGKLVNKYRTSLLDLSTLSYNTTTWSSYRATYPSDMDITDVTKIMASKYAYKDYDDLHNNPVNGFFTFRNQYIYITDSTTPSGDMQYPLVEASWTTTTLTAEQISLLKGNNVVFSDSNGNIKLTYSADIKAFIENQLSNS